MCIFYLFKLNPENHKICMFYLLKLNLENMYVAAAVSLHLFIQFPHNWSNPHMHPYTFMSYKQCTRISINCVFYLQIIRCFCYVILYIMCPCWSLSNFLPYWSNPQSTGLNGPRYHILLFESTRNVHIAIVFLYCT